MEVCVIHKLHIATELTKFFLMYDKSQHQHEHDSVVIVLLRSCKQKTPSGGADCSPKVSSLPHNPSEPNTMTCCKAMPQCITARHMAQSLV